MIKIAFLAADTQRAQDALASLVDRYGNCDPKQADVIVPLGGDGFLLQTAHNTIALDAPIYGMRKGSVGFLHNDYREDSLPERIAAAHKAPLTPLKMTAKTIDGKEIDALAFNEVSLLRSTRQAAKLEVIVDDVQRLEELICDGILVSTPAGSTAYNLSAHGPILPLSANLLAVTPISAFRPRRWRGALVPQKAKIKFVIREAAKRPISVVADDLEVCNVAEILVEQENSASHTLLFDPDQNLEERILKEQFMP